MYPPSEDSFLLSKQVKIYLNKIPKSDLKKLLILDIGSGSGIQTKTCIKSGIPKKNILCTDIDSEVIKHLKSLNLQTIKSNLFSKIKQKFNLIIFNPPYLPQNKYDIGVDLTGGKLGDETILKFLKQAKSHIHDSGVILLLTSSLTPETRINQLIKKLNYKKTKLSEQKLFFEKLYVWKISLK